MEWFNCLDNTVKVALITGAVGIVIAVINGLFVLASNGKKKAAEAGHKIKQISKGSDNVVIGIQNNYDREK